MRLRPVLLALPFGRVAVGAVCAAAVAVLGTVPRIPTGAGAGPLTRAVEVSIGSTSCPSVVEKACRRKGYAAEQRERSQG